MDLATVREPATSINATVPRTEESANDLDRSSPSLLGSSVQSVFEQRVVTQPALDDKFYSTVPLPPYASPPTPLQKQHWRDKGIIGPITGLQHVQILAAKLGDPPSDDQGETEWFPPIHRPLSTERSNRIRSWLAQHEPYELQPHEPAPHRQAPDREARRARLEQWVAGWKNRA